MADEKKSKPVKYEDYTPVDEPTSSPSTPAPKLGSGIVVKKASGGSASSRADGIAMRGKTRGTMVMCGGGMSK